MYWFQNGSKLNTVFQLTQFFSKRNSKSEILNAYCEILWQV